MIFAIGTINVRVFYLFLGRESLWLVRFGRIDDWRAEPFV
jgi:hypothetical protein